MDGDTDEEQTILKKIKITLILCKFSAKCGTSLRSGAGASLQPRKRDALFTLSPVFRHDVEKR
jgi:hypothetical protein